MGVEPILRRSQHRVQTATLQPRLNTLAEGLGIEPRTHESKSCVIPFHHPPALPYRNTLQYDHNAQKTWKPKAMCNNVFLYGRDTENRTLIYWLKASYFSR